MSVLVNYLYPSNGKVQSDHDASMQAMIEVSGWFLDPLINGDYADELKTKFGADLPVFTEDEKNALRGSIDFIAIEHYSSTPVSY